MARRARPAVMSRRLHGRQPGQAGTPQTLGSRPRLSHTPTRCGCLMPTRSSGESWAWAVRASYSALDQEL